MLATMIPYLSKRLALVIPTLFGIMVLNFLIVQLAPGGPIEQIIAQVKDMEVGATSRISGGGTEVMSAQDAANAALDSAKATSATTSDYRGAQGLDPDFIADLERQFGFDKPLWERFWHMIGNYARFDFGQSYYRDVDVWDLVLEKLPVSISLGLWSTLLIYLISIPLGIAKAVRDGSKFDILSSAGIIVGYAIPSFMFAILLIIVFAGGRYLSWFPLRGIASDNAADLGWWARMLDYAWHLALPTLAMVISGFASLTMLTKNSFLDEINKAYVLTARAKGASERRILWKHIFRNAMLIVIAGFPAAFIGILFTGALLIEVIFSLDGLGLLGFEAAINRDYPVMFGTLYLFTLIGLVLNILSDMTYVLIDPRIDFDKRGAG